MKIILLFCVLMIFTSTAHASKDQDFKIYCTQEKKYIHFDRLIYKLASMDFILLGENHDNQAHHDMQKIIMENVAMLGPVSSGLEFIDWTQQDNLYHYILNYIDETEFLQRVGWGNNFSFNFYKPLIWIAAQSGGHSFGINAPSWLVRKVSVNGLDSLTLQEQSFVPPRFQMNEGLYFELFKDAMSEHSIPPDALHRYFQAQNLWDDSMAFHSILNMQHSCSPFFIIVGKFHVRYKLGLPAQLSRRLNGEAQRMAVITHVDAQHLSNDQMDELTEKHPRYGYLADYIIFTFK